LSRIDTKMKANSDSSPFDACHLYRHTAAIIVILRSDRKRRMGEEKDLPPGGKLVECFTPFLLRPRHVWLGEERTIRNHVDKTMIESTHGLYIQDSIQGFLSRFIEKITFFRSIPVIKVLSSRQVKQNHLE